LFKKIEIWVLYLFFLLGFIFTVFFGALVKYELHDGKFLEKYNLGWIARAALFLAEIPGNSAKILDNDNAVEDRFTSLAGFNGTPNSKESYLLLSRYDGDFKEGVVELIDLTNFNVLHTWNPDIDKFNSLVEQVDEFKFITQDNNNYRQTLKSPKLTKDGGLLFNSFPLRKINSCSELIFQNTHNRFHHSIETDIDGNIWVPSRLYPHSLPSKMVGKDVESFKDDAIVKLDTNGKVIFEKSVSQIFIDNGMEYLLFAIKSNDFPNDPIHLNDIQPVNSDTDYWKKGDVFLSLRNQSMVILYRPSTNKIVWKFTGPLFFQHDVDILDNHSVSIFNNNNKNYIIGDIVDGHNEVIIYDFKTGNHTSYLKDSLVKNDVRTINQGSGQILPNGDLYIEETNYGRTLYFNKDGSLKWQHINRAKDGNTYNVGWSQILYTKEDLKFVNDFLTNKINNCYE